MNPIKQELQAAAIDTKICRIFPANIKYATELLSDCTNYYGKATIVFTIFDFEQRFSLTNFKFMV